MLLAKYQLLKDREKNAKMFILSKKNMHKRRNIIYFHGQNGTPERLK
jgi:hypothetical protein